MLTVNYTIDFGPMPPNGPKLHFVRNGTPIAAEISATHTTFLADPGTAWQIDSTFTTSSGDARYVARDSEESNLHGTANQSMVHSLAYRVQYPVSVDVSSGGSVSYAFNMTTGTIESGRNGTFFVFPGDTVNVTARPSSVFYVFSGWTGDLAGTVPSGSITVARSQSVVARFVLNWALIAAMSTVAVVAAVASVVLLRRRRRTAKPPIAPAMPPPTPPIGPPPPS
jgi:uncharacterized repeat protein (TIGR02543 family)